jgi:hypothetical protein
MKVYYMYGNYKTMIVKRYSSIHESKGKYHKNYLLIASCSVRDKIKE